MMRYVLLGAALMIFIISTPACAPRQPAQLPHRPQGSYTWTGVWRSLTQISPGFLDAKLRDPKAKQLLEKMVEQTNVLNQIWNGNEDKIDENYLMEMTLEAILLDEAAKSMPEDKAYDVLKEVAADIEIKLDHCRRHPQGMGSRVNLKVSIVSASGDSSQWQVFHVIVGNKKYLGEPGKPLRKMSNPAEGTVSVGNNLIWAQKGNITTKEQTYLIGLGKDDREIEIPVP